MVRQHRFPLGKIGNMDATPLWADMPGDTTVEHVGLGLFHFDQLATKSSLYSGTGCYGGRSEAQAIHCIQRSLSDPRTKLNAWSSRCFEP